MHALELLSYRRLAVGALIVLGPWLARSAAQGPPPAPVRVDAVRVETVQELRQVSGELRARHRSLVATEEEGRVVELLVREGQAVEAGAPIARLDGSRLELELAFNAAERAVAGASLAERDHSLAQAERDLETVRLLAEREAANPKELADAQSSVLTAKARREQAVQAIEVLDARKRLLEDRVAKKHVTAPFAGTVVARHTDLGEWVQVGDPLVELSSTGQLEAWLDVPQQDLAAIAATPGAIRLSTGWGADEWLIEDFRAVAQVDPRARTWPLVLTMPAGLPLAPGMSVQAEVPTAARSEQLTVSHAAVLHNEVGPFVYAAVPGPTAGSTIAVPMPIQVQFRTRERTVIRVGALQPGMLVIVEGNERLYPTAPVKVLEDAPKGGGQVAGDAR